ncbi:MAG: transferrin-binding protein-like solute binding protein, partial [Acidiferrobacterales bacterium]
SFNATVNFGLSSITGAMQVVNGANTWNVTFPLFVGTVNGSTFSVPAVGGDLNASFPITGSVVGGFTGPNGAAMGGVFDVEQTSVPLNHVEGVFVATQ